MNDATTSTQSGPASVCQNPAAAFTILTDGNARFVDGRAEHPRQDSERRAVITAVQHPTAVVLGCSDSRVAPEIVFDQGLGDMFVARTAGHVVDSAVLGSIEYAVAALDVPLIAVLGHDGCGAVTATVAASDGGAAPVGAIGDLIEKTMPSIATGRRNGHTEVAEFVRWHVHETIGQLMSHSTIIANRIVAGTLGIVGLTYRLTDGHTVLHDHVGDVVNT